MTESERLSPDTMAIDSVRYCLGRRTYIVHDCVDFLEAAWPELLPETKATIQTDVESEFARDDRHRAQGDRDYLPLGMDMDRKEWERARNLWRTE